MIGEKDKTAMINRLARIEGQLRGISKMMAADAPDCEKVAQQMSAARKALDKAQHTMLACMVEEHIRTGTDASADELGKLISKYA
ncbi:metal-sensitive transcriptional regulator [Kordiimonas sp.]|uniref:metal-sensitive transcriptional regulator n=1 Tax=Kordiimonas sp. TaxID=1970157 RepID=UPI003A8CB52C